MTILPEIRHLCGHGRQSFLDRRAHLDVPFLTLTNRTPTRHNHSMAIPKWLALRAPSRSANSARNALCSPGIFGNGDDGHTSPVDVAHWHALRRPSRVISYTWSGGAKFRVEAHPPRRV